MDLIHYQPSVDDYMSEESDDDMRTISIKYGKIEMIVDFDGMISYQEVQMADAVEELTEEMELVSFKQTTKYKKYGQDQIDRFIRIKQEQGLSVLKPQFYVAYLEVPRMS